MGMWLSVSIDFAASILTALVSAAGRASQEMDSSKNHMIVEDGYNRGRNYIVERATRGSHWRGMWWKAEVQWQDGLLERGKRGPYSFELPVLGGRLTDHVSLLLRYRCQSWHRAGWSCGHLDRSSALNSPSLPQIEFGGAYPASSTTDSQRSIISPSRHLTVPLLRVETSTSRPYRHHHPHMYLSFTMPLAFAWTWRG